MANDDLNKMSIKQLESKLKDNEEALLNFRFQKVLQQLENPFQIRNAKKEIARIKTILREYELDIRKAAK
ncbi:50S ribosomal protein L29 [bacterium]|nr:MAG: 50S ribosomal protein L29 [bacterium TMED6]RCL86177.1 MAG: 50S ribosomal protein L29 [bacterium]|tara:strand:+ start:300 stop:509 length:210 start_codon:yes stop_codon:yes gene_type:complete